MENDSASKKIIIPQSLTVKKFSEILETPLNIVITELMKNGIFATINESIDFETASIIAGDLGFSASAEDEAPEREKMTLESLVNILRKEKDTGENLKKRPPVVTILGHVDHGKTTLLDTIRKTNVVAKEAGGITQHISAYQVKKKGRLITFIDTPGHEAFSSMRERGVSLADIAVLVVAADDGVRPQTKEVIDYLLAKKIPTVVAINKIDKPGINVQKVKQELADNGILLEEWGGEVLSSKISAKQNIGIDELLDNVLLLDEVENFEADYNRSAIGVVLESNLDPQKGPIAAVLVKTGTLKIGQDIVAGETLGRVRGMEDFKGMKINEATPSMPVAIIGFESTPNVNDILQVVTKKASVKLHHSLRSGKMMNVQIATAQKIVKAIADENIKKLNVILKADVQGSLEALKQILEEIRSEEVTINYISDGVGNITESDVRLAANSDAVIFGFNVTITTVANRMAENSNVDIKIYKIIYELIEEIKKRLIAMLPKQFEREEHGKMKVLAIFRTEKGSMIVGGKVTNGKLVGNSLIEIVRGDSIIGNGKLKNLQQNKVDVNEVSFNNECGITFMGDAKIKIDDILVCYDEVEIKKTL